ncbi:reverse transcriptase domain-containing protein [Tanacetum coccineum]
MDLPSTYKVLMEKTYTWVEASEVATNGASSDQRDNFERSKKSSWDNNRGQKNKDRFSLYRGPNHSLLPSLSKSTKEILATKKAARSFEPLPNIHLITKIQEAVNLGQHSHLVKGIKKERSRSFNTLQGESKKYKGTAPAEAPILMVNREAHIAKSLTQENTDYEGKEIIFPLVAKVNNAPVIIEAKIFGRKVGRVYMDSGSSCEIIYEHCFEKLNPTIKATKVDLKTPLVGFSRERSWSIGEVPLEITIGDAPLSRIDTLNFVIYPDQMVTIGKQLPEHFKKELQNLLKSNANVFAWTYTNMIGILRTIMVEGKPFNTEHKLNEYCHVKPIKQNKRGLGPDRNMAACKETKELTKAGILRKGQAPNMGSYGLPSNPNERRRQRQNSLLRRRSLLLQEYVVWSQKCRATYQRLVDKVFSHQIGRSLEAYTNNMVIKSTSENEMLKDIQETFKRNEKEMPTDFLVEIPFEDNEKKEKPKEVPDSNSKWRLYTDGASNSDGSRAGLMLIDPEGLQIARELEIIKVAIFLDSQLLVNQIKGTNAAKQTSIKDYLQKVKTALRGFKEYTIDHVRRNQNKKADALSKLASMTFEHLIKEVLVEVLTKRSIEEKEVLKVDM